MPLPLPTRCHLNIGVITETFPPEVNGVALTVGRLVDEMCRRGHHVQLVRPRRSREAAIVAPEDANEAPLTTALVPGFPVPWYRELRSGFPSASRLRSVWRRERPDLDVAPLEILSRVSRLARRLDLARGSAFAEHGLEGWEFDVLSALRRHVIHGITPWPH